MGAYSTPTSTFIACHTLHIHCHDGGGGIRWVAGPSTDYNHIQKQPRSIFFSFFSSLPSLRRDISLIPFSSFSHHHHFYRFHFVWETPPFTQFFTYVEWTLMRNFPPTPRILSFLIHSRSICPHHVLNSVYRIADTS